MPGFSLFLLSGTNLKRRGENVSFDYMCLDVDDVESTIECFLVLGFVKSKGSFACHNTTGKVYLGTSLCLFQEEVF